MLKKRRRKDGLRQSRNVTDVRAEKKKKRGVYFQIVVSEGESFQEYINRSVQINLK